MCHSRAWQHPNLPQLHVNLPTAYCYSYVFVIIVLINQQLSPYYISVIMLVGNYLVSICSVGEHLELEFFCRTMNFW